MKRTWIIITHILACILAAAGFSSLYLSSPAGYGISWTTKEAYEDTPQFSARLNEDIQEIQELALLTAAFEENGELARDEIVADMEADGTFRALSLREAMQTAQTFGCYLESGTNELVISGSSAADEQKNEEVKVVYKYYDPDFLDNVPAGPGAGVTTIRELTLEVMRKLARYYSLKARYIEKDGNLYFQMSYVSADGEELDFTNTQKTAEELLKLGKYVYVTDGGETVESNVDPVPESAVKGSLNYSIDQEEEGTSFLAAVDTQYPYQDAYKTAARHFEGDVRTAYLAVGFLAVGLLFCLITLVMLLRFDGYDNREQALRLRPADKLPVEIYLLLCAAGVWIGCALMGLTGYRAVRVLTPQSQWRYWRQLLKLAVYYAFCLYALLGLIRRGHNGGLFDRSVLHGMIADLNDYAAHAKAASGLFFRYAFLIGGNLVLGAMIIWCYLRRETNGWYLPAFAVGLVLLAVLNLIAFRRLYRTARERDRLDEAISVLSEGNTDYEVDTSAFSGREKTAAEHLNHISTGMRTALTEQVKSERLKADLITNVSHDIRTPLTSIINYVDLLKRENIDDPKAQEYIEVLDKKSARLKNLTEDLLEASKASSGNIKMDIRRIDLVELAMQAGAEFEDKFAARGLELCLTTPEHAVFIRADGRHLWRVLENLYNNAAKYSMEHTRIYADVKEQGENAVFTIKNISAAKLNISPDELTERFVRGDVSRTTEGSGLGLSIAKSLTTLQGGELKIEIDGDLYKANVIFPRDAAEDVTKNAADQTAEKPEEGGVEIVK